MSVAVGTAPIFISIHALLAEGDIQKAILDHFGKISIHALLAEGDIYDKLRNPHITISIHALLAEGDDKQRN